MNNPFEILDTKYPYTLPELGYSYDALEPYIDAKTIELHYSKHHQGYVNKLNSALEQYPKLQEKTLQELLSNLATIPEDIRTAIRNNGGGHANHSLYWYIMTPPQNKDMPKELVAIINKTFGDMENFKQELYNSALTRFGSGWAWLFINETGSLEVDSTPNQDSPISNGSLPILGIDVWEHAYYLKYQNRRGEYIKNWIETVNWNKVNELLHQAEKQ